MKTQQTLSPTDTLEELIKWLLPEQANLQVDRLVFTPGELTLLVTSTQPVGRCPVCEKATRRIHSRYWRTLEDLPWGANRLRLRVHVRRFVCATASCPRKIFTERLGPLAEPSARRTDRLRDALLALGWAVGGEEGSRQGMVHHMPIGASTLLSLMRRHGERTFPTPRVLGVDDWFFQQDHPTGTILVDLERHQPVDLLLGSDEQVLSDWLRSHRGVQIISRDRGAGYRKASERAAPQVKQVLDRWHLLKNLGEVIQKTLAQQIDVLRQAGQQVKNHTQQTSFAPPESAQPDGQRRKPPRRKPSAPSPRRAWQMAMHQQVHELAAEGKTQAEIISRLHLHRQTVRKYLRMPTFVAHYCSPHPSSVEPYRAYLEARWHQGEVMIKTLWRELQGQGFTGSYKSVWTFLRHWPLPAGLTPTSSCSSVAALTRRGAPATPTPWRLKWLLLHKPEELKAKDAAYRQALLYLSPHLSSLSALGQDFVRLIRERQSEALLPWLERAKGCPFEELQRF